MRILLANFAECPENLHFERAFLRAAAAAGARADVVHDYDCEYSFVGRGLPRGARRLKYDGLAGLKRLCGEPYDLAVALDFPKRRRCAPGFLWLLREAPAGKKVFVANHLMPMPGHNFTADLARRVKALAGLDGAYILESDGRALWRAVGLSGRRLIKRGYATDCGYYKPQRARPGAYVFSAGSAGRDFNALAAGAALAGLRLKVFSDAAPGGVGPGADFLPLAGNLHRLRAAAAGARAVVIPVRDGYKNEAAGNSIAFLAMAMGLPVLARRTRYMERFIKDGVNGYLYRRLSAAALAAGLRRVLALAPERRRKLGAAARAVMLRKAGLDAFCAEFLAKHLRRRRAARPRP